MKMPLAAAMAAILATLVANIPDGAPAATIAPPIAPLEQQQEPARFLSVMTYNVKGLPWPAAFGRAAAMSQIGQHFAQLRRENIQPHIILLQEAFIQEAKQLGAMGGYPYIAIGPQPDDSSATPTASIAPEFRSRAQWLAGEREGKWVDSGLVILSDYPIVETAKMAFPADACAGFDCLSSKGVVLARVKVPGVAKPVAIVDTHLNSRKASGVSKARANAAFAWQAAAVRRFVSTHVDPQTDIILGGDFNIGHDPLRIREAGLDGGLLPKGREAIATMVGLAHDQADIGADLAPVVARAKDKEYFRPANGSKLALHDVEVPFVADAGGFDLSDHIGFIANFDIQ